MSPVCRWRPLGPWLLTEFVGEPVSIVCWSANLRQIVSNLRTWIGFGTCWPWSLRQVGCNLKNRIGFGLLALLPSANFKVPSFVRYPLSHTQPVASVKVDLLLINVK
jgi:hypothetical protein